MNTNLRHSIDSLTYCLDLSIGLVSKAVDTGDAVCKSVSSFLTKKVVEPAFLQIVDWSVPADAFPSDCGNYRANKPFDGLTIIWPKSAS